MNDGWSVMSDAKTIMPDGVLVMSDGHVDEEARDFGFLVFIALSSFNTSKSTPMIAWTIHYLHFCRHSRVSCPGRGTPW